jgi:alpha-beta hydrolase superfamily lysophospholipase
LTNQAEFTQQTALGNELRLPVCSWIDRGKPAQAIILALHGVTLYSGNFDATAKHLAGQGYPVYALDMRGFGRWQTESGNFSGDSGIHYTQSREDLEIVLQHLREQYPDKKIICLGESIGANLAVWLASTRPNYCDGVILSSPCIKHCFHPYLKLPLDTIAGLLAPNKRHHTRPYIDRYLSDDRRVTDAYFADPLIVHSMSPAEMVKSLKTNTLTLLSAKNVPTSMPVLIVAGANDSIYHASAIPSFVEQLGSRNKTVVIEPKKGHLLLETEFVEPKILSVIDDWLSTMTQSGHISGVSSISKDNVTSLLPR